MIEQILFLKSRIGTGIRNLIPKKDKKSWDRFFVRVFPTWVFNSWRTGILKQDETVVFSLVEIVVWTDVMFFFSCHGIPLPSVDEIVSSLSQVWESKRVFTFSTKDKLYLSDHQWRRLRECYTGPSKDFYDWVCVIVSTYWALGLSNKYLSFPPTLFEGWIEMFGSPLNSQGIYCSALEIEKTHFSSLGSFYDLELEENKKYIANPPFDETMMEAMAERIIGQLDKTKNCIVSIILPVWDDETQIDLGIRPRHLPFKALDLLKSSKHFVEQTLLPPENYGFYDYFTEKIIPITYMHFLTLSSSDAISEEDTHRKICSVWNLKYNCLSFRKKSLYAANDLSS
jgi:hypothetical protein